MTYENINNQEIDDASDVVKRKVINVEIQELEENKKENPIGLGKELEANRESKELNAEEVKNTLVWINPHLKSPFNLQLGKQCKLGLFLQPKPKEEKDYLKVEGGYKHGRTALLRRIIFSDDQNRLYRDIDLKGIGSIFAKPHFQVGPVEIYEAEHQRLTRGIFDVDQAKNEAEVGEKLAALGIRVSRVIGIALLKEIIDKKGEKIPVEDMIKKGIIDSNENPAISIRAFGTKARIRDLEENDPILLEDARTIVAQELGIMPEKFSKLDYWRWFEKTIRSQIDVLYKNHLSYGFHSINDHNITLDARFTDFDSFEDTSLMNDDQVENLRKQTNSVVNQLLEKFKKVLFRTSS